MGKILRTLGFFLLVAIITLGIFLLVVPNKKTQQDVLQYSLNLLGDKLLAMVPDKEDQESVKKQYDEFVAKATNKELSPEQIETVAASIINVSNSEKELSGKEAYEVIKVTETTEPDSVSEVETIEPSHPHSGIKRPPRPLKPPRWKHYEPEDWEDLGERLSSIYNINENIQRIVHESMNIDSQRTAEINYQIDTGLKVAMDEKVRHKLEGKEYRLLAKELGKLEKEKMLIWRENMQAGMEGLRIGLESLEHLKELRHLEGLESLHSLQGLEALGAISSLEVLKNIPGIDPDSIRIIIETSLKEAGIEPEKEEE